MIPTKKKNLFKLFCIANGLTAKQVAEDCGLSTGTVWAYYQGTRSPSKRTMKVLAEKYGIDPYKFFLQ